MLFPLPLLLYGSLPVVLLRWLVGRDKIIGVGLVGIVIGDGIGSDGNGIAFIVGIAVAVVAGIAGLRDVTAHGYYTLRMEDIWEGVESGVMEWNHPFTPIRMIR